MRIHRFALVGAALASAVAVAACTSSVVGSAQPAPGQGPVAPAKSAADPCTLLTPDQLASLGFKPKPDLEPADPSHATPATCSWDPADPGSASGLLFVHWSEVTSLDDFLSGNALMETFDLGGQTWTRYATLAGKSTCAIYVSLSPQSFVGIWTENEDDATKACDTAKVVAPLVWAHLPSGTTASPATPPTSATG